MWHLKTCLTGPRCMPLPKTVTLPVYSSSVFLNQDTLTTEMNAGSRLFIWQRGKATGMSGIIMWHEYFFSCYLGLFSLPTRRMRVWSSLSRDGSTTKPLSGRVATLEAVWSTGYRLLVLYCADPGCTPSILPLAGMPCIVNSRLIFLLLIGIFNYVMLI